MSKNVTVYLLADPKSRRSCQCSLFPTAFLLSLLSFIGSTFAVTDYKENTNSLSSLAIAVGIKQKKYVDLIVQKFPSSDFVIMLFHYDGVVDAWRDLEWSDRSIHMSVVNQAKCYTSIVKEEGLHISQPTLDATKFEVHHQITTRGRRSRVGRNDGTYFLKRSLVLYVVYDPVVIPKVYGSCAIHSLFFITFQFEVHFWSAFALTGYLFFSQNNLIHAWGVDMQLGYCTQVEQTQNVGVVDSEYLVEYIVHQGLPTQNILYTSGIPLLFQYIVT
ncbi:hypothetical protein GIB67_011880 [Kingdonia uniflora]|uniref:Uncharacterized protein n=1 Tax=Kingdonia uniflora TaxID=39325 RepID=A0A7J7KVZ5_9MAGN|nr:hypothetical protein GIB67_011880 [Kingdonia uniflora]